MLNDRGTGNSFNGKYGENDSIVYDTLGAYVSQNLNRY
jgi:hypothetical protein